MRHQVLEERFAVELTLLPSDLDEGSSLARAGQLSRDEAYDYDAEAADAAAAADAGTATPTCSVGGSS